MEEMKICSYCKIEKNIKEFSKYSSSKDGLNSSCKKCRKEITERSLKKIGRKPLTEEQKKNRKEYKAKWFQENKERLKRKPLTEEQKKNRKEYKAKWFQENKERLITENLKKRKNDPKIKINHLMSNSILKCLGRKKDRNKWTDIVGYTYVDLYNHFKVSEIPNGYHIDHIIPVSAYNYSFVDEEFLKCWNIRNLRLIPAEENLKKGGRIIKELIEEYKIKDLLPKEVIFEDLE